MTTYYAISHRYGANMRDDRGDMIGTIHEFSSAKARAAWVAEGNAYHFDADAREALSRKRSVEARAIRRALLSRNTVKQADRDYLTAQDAA